MYLNVRGEVLRQTGIMVVPHLCNSNRSHRKCTALPDTNPGGVMVHFQSSSPCGKPGLQKRMNSSIWRKFLIKSQKFCRVVIENTEIFNTFKQVHDWTKGNNTWVSHFIFTAHTAAKDRASSEHKKVWTEIWIFFWLEARRTFLQEGYKQS